MARLILKSPFIKGGARAVNYAKYIGTRERVELVPDGRPATKKQEQLIASLVNDFPDAKKLPAYSVYSSTPTKVNASEFITQALEDNWDSVQQSDIYAEYIATRLRVERLGSHGLFGDEDYVDLKKVTVELQNCEKNVWTHIVSLKREDAARLGYDNARAWRNLLRAHRNDIAAAMNIPPNDFRWYAAFHDEGDHPHVHMMARLPSVQMCYKKWLELQQEVNEFYSDKPMEHVPLSQQKGFRAIHNAVVQAAVQLGQLTFEDKGLESSDEPDDALWASTTYQQLWTVICDSNFSLEMRDQAVVRLRSKAEDGDSHAQFLLSRLYRDGPLLTPDWVGARYWFEQAAQSLPDAQYALGKLLLTDDVEIHNQEQGFCWLTQAAENGNEYAAYRLGKELLRSGDTAQALSWLTVSAEAGNPYAEYLLGKLYWEGETVSPDKERAVYWLTQAAEQGHTHAQILLERQDSSSLPSAILAVNSLLHQMVRIFQDNIWPKDGTHGQRTDRKLRRRIREKKIAMGHKPDDQEEQGCIGPAM